MKKTNVLFISHESSRSGAPLLFLQLLQWLVANRSVTPIILINRNGVLDPEFKAVGKTFFYYQKKVSINRSLLFKIYTRYYNSDLGKEIFLFVLKIKLLSQRPALIYSNTISNGFLLEYCKFLNIPCISHIHEAKHLTTYFGEENLALIKNYTSHFIACSGLVKKSLVDNFNVPPEKISLVYSSINPGIASPGNMPYANPILERLKTKKKVIGGSGGFGWIKGTDLIVPFMEKILAADNTVCFVWIGGNLSSDEYKKIEKEIIEKDLSDDIFFTGPVSDPHIYFSLINLFIVLSREDAFGLVTLENSILENPFLCFQDACGAQELLVEWPENIIPYLDLDKLAQRTIELLENTELSKQIGISLKRKVLQNFTVDSTFPEIYFLIEKQLRNEVVV